MSELKEKELQQNIFLNRFQRSLHSIASASFWGFLLVLPVGIFCTSLIFLLINSLLYQPSSWKDAFQKFPDGQQIHNSKLAADRTLRASSKETQDNFLSRVGLILTRNKNELVHKKRSLIPPKHGSSLDHSETITMYFLLNGKNIENIKGSSTDAQSTFVAAYALLAIELTEQWNRTTLMGNLWIVVVSADGSLDWSPQKQITLFEQHRWLVQLWPTQTIMEPGAVGNWLIHHFKEALKKEFTAGYLYPDKKNRFHAQKFINDYLYHTITKQITLTEQSFWATFMNGADGWGMIQWLSVLLAVLSIFILGARFLLVSSEIFTLEYWSNISPIALKMDIKSHWIHRMRYEISRNESEMPQPRLLATLNLVDNDTHTDSSYVQVRLESSRRIVEFFINSLASIGFIGTIVGIAFAINQAYLVIDPDEFVRLQAVKSLSTNLALAFSTTFVALVLTLICDALAKRQWRKEDQLIEAYTRIHQIWHWSDKKSFLEQAENSIMPKM